MIQIGDGCTYACVETVPIMAESVEAAFCSFDDAVIAAKKDTPQGWHIIWMDRFFNEGELESNGPPEFYTLDEWFKKFEEKIV